jgi:hypothetical protein
MSIFAFQVLPYRACLKARDQLVHDGNLTHWSDIRLLQERERHDF